MSEMQKIRLAACPLGADFGAGEEMKHPRLHLAMLVFVTGLTVFFPVLFAVLGELTMEFFFGAAVTVLLYSDYKEISETLTEMRSKTSS